MSSLEPLYGWTDAKLFDKVKSLKLSNLRTTDDGIIDILSAFWNYWITGTYPGKSSLTVIIGHVITLIVTPESNAYSLKYLLELGTNGKPLCEDLETIPFDKYPSWTYASCIKRNKQKSKGTQHFDFKDYTSTDYDNFSEWVRKTLKTFSLNKMESLNLLKITSLMVLICLRASAKTKLHFENEMFKKNILMNISRVMHLYTLDLCFAPPCEKFVDELFTTMKKNKIITRNIISIIVAAYVKLTVAPTVENFYVKSFLDYGCMQSTKWSGLQIIKMMFEIKQKIYFELCRIVEYYMTNEIHESWLKVDRFMEECLMKDNFQHSLHWCRWIHPEYYSDLSPYSNPELAVYLGGILSVGTKYYWDSEWGKKLSIQYSVARIRGEEIYCILLEKQRQQAFKRFPSLKKMMKIEDRKNRWKQRNCSKTDDIVTHASDTELATDSEDVLNKATSVSSLDLHLPQTKIPDSSQKNSQDSFSTQIEFDNYFRKFCIGNRTDLIPFLTIFNKCTNEAWEKEEIIKEIFYVLSNEIKNFEDLLDFFYSTSCKHKNHTLFIQLILCYSYQRNFYKVEKEDVDFILDNFRLSCIENTTQTSSTFLSKFFISGIISSIQNQNDSKIIKIMNKIKNPSRALGLFKDQILKLQTFNGIQQKKTLQYFQHLNYFEELDGDYCISYLTGLLTGMMMDINKKSIISYDSFISEVNSMFYKFNKLCTEDNNVIEAELNRAKVIYTPLIERLKWSKSDVQELDSTLCKNIVQVSKANFTKNGSYKRDDIIVTIKDFAIIHVYTNCEKKKSLYKWIAKLPKELGLRFLEKDTEKLMEFAESMNLTMLSISSKDFVSKLMYLDKNLGYIPEATSEWKLEEEWIIVIFFFFIFLVIFIHLIYLKKI